MKFNWDSVSRELELMHSEAGIEQIRTQYEYLESRLNEEGIEFQEGTLVEFLPHYEPEELPAFKVGEWVACWDRWGFVVENTTNPELPFLDQVSGQEAAEFLVREMNKQ